MTAWSADSGVFRSHRSAVVAPGAAYAAAKPETGPDPAGSVQNAQTAFRRGPWTALRNAPLDERAQQALIPVVDRQEPCPTGFRTGNLDRVELHPVSAVRIRRHPAAKETAESLLGDSLMGSESKLIGHPSRDEPRITQALGRAVPVALIERGSAPVLPQRARHGGWCSVAFPNFGLPPSAIEFIVSGSANRRLPETARAVPRPSGEHRRGKRQRGGA